MSNVMPAERSPLLPTSGSEANPSPFFPPTRLFWVFSRKRWFLAVSNQAVDPNYRGSCYRLSCIPMPRINNGVSPDHGTSVILQS
jgi:hypothetical protein